MDIFAMEFSDLYDFAHRLRTVDIFPFFDIANSIKVAVMVRASLGPKFDEYATLHPMTCWLTTILSQSVGGIITNVLLGNPALAAFANPYKLATATIIWYLIFYSSGNFCHRVATFPPVSLVYSAMAEVHRAWRISSGVSAAAELYPSSYVIMIVIGGMRGNGKNALDLMLTLVDRLTSPNPTKTVQLVSWSKFSLLAATLFALSRLYAKNEDAIVDFLPAKLPTPPVMADLVYLAVVVIFEIFMLWTFIKQSPRTSSIKQKSDSENKKYR